MLLVKSYSRQLDDVDLTAKLQHMSKIAAVALGFAALNPTYRA